MTDRSLLLSAPMALANWAGRKSHTRRAAANKNAQRIAVGDRLWVREAFRLEQNFDGLPPSAISGLNYKQMPVWYEADHGKPGPRSLSEWEHPWGRHRASMFMPKWASRMTLDVLEIRTERLGDISKLDAMAEGLSASSENGDVRYGIPSRTGMASDFDIGWDWSEWEPDPRRAYFKLFARIAKIPIDELDLDQDVIVIRYRSHRRNILSKKAAA